MGKIMDRTICSRRGFLKSVGLASVGLAPFLKACDILPGKFQPGEVKMEAGTVRNNPAVSRRSLPPIDAAVPERLETAAFALG